MKSIIKEILSKQGMSKNELLRQTKLYKIDQIWYGRDCKLKEEEKNLLLNLANKPSCRVANRNEPLILNFNGKEYLNVLACSPSKSRTGFNLCFRETGDFVTIWYQPKTRRKCEFMFKKYIHIDNFFVTCLGLSLGDGLNNPNMRNNHYNFASINFELAFLIYDWLKNYLNVNPSKMHISIRIPFNQKELNIKNLEKRFDYKIRTYKVSRCANQMLFIQVSNGVFQCFYLSLFNKLKEKILTKSCLRRAFLKGLFAAEGHVKHSVYGTLESINFAFNPQEKEFLLFVKKCLKKEGIFSKENKKGSSLYFCGYENMIKFYLTGAPSLHREKEGKFLELVKNVRPVLHFKKGYLEPLRDYSQHKLANILGCSQSSLCKALKMNFFSLEHLIKLGEMLDASFESIMQNVWFITIRTSSVKNKNSIKFLLSLLPAERFIKRT